MIERNSSDHIVVQQLTELITGHNAHENFEQVVANLPFKDVGIKPLNLPYSIWMLIEHIRIAQWDILEFSRNPSHQSPKWPDEYWPTEVAPSNEKEWKESLQQIRKDRDDFIALLHDPSIDLYSPFKHGEGQNLLREAMLIADHISYHLGQIVVIRRVLQDWKG